MTGENNPWDKYLPPIEELTFQVHGLTFYVTNDTESVTRPADGRAVFTVSETRLLQRAVPGKKLPPELSKAIHAVKRILGGEVVHCVIDSTPPKL